MNVVATEMRVCGIGILKSQLTQEFVGSEFFRKEHKLDSVGNLDSIDYFIIIPNIIVQKNKYSPETIFIYALLQRNLTIRNKIIFSLSWLYSIFNVSRHNVYSRKRILNNLIILENDGYINYNCDINSIENEDLIFASFTSIDDSFVKILDVEFDLISNCPNINRYNLFCLFSNIKSRIDTKRYCYPSENELKKNIGINSDVSISKYLKILKQLKLIDYRNPGEIIIEKDGRNHVVQSNNIYALYNDREILEDIIQRRIEDYESYNIKMVQRKENNITTNEKRSIAMKEYWKKKKGRIFEK
jgi:hypothetical protein